MIVSNEAQSIIKKIEDAGFEAYFVGGYVRDILMGRPPGDIDIATNAFPDDIMRIFEKTIPTGINHGTVTVLYEGISVEVTTYRCESSYNDVRHPDNVQFINDINEDIKRRDFTVNAIAYNPAKPLLDIVGGKEDIENKIIRCVGNPNERFSEDALRMLRAVRFASVLGFEIESKTLDAITKNAALISRISKERVATELEKCVLGDFTEKIRLFADTGLAKHLSSYDAIDFSKTDSLRTLPKNLSLRFAYILKKDLATGFLKSLKFSNKIINNTASLIEGFGIETIADIKKYINKNGFEHAMLLKSINGRRFSENLEIITKENHPVFISDLAIDGNDLEHLGITGKEVGIALQFLLSRVWDTPSLNSREMLIKLIKEDYRK